MGPIVERPPTALTPQPIGAISQSVATKNGGPRQRLGDGETSRAFIEIKRNQAKHLTDEPDLF
jgi:hypothetical protein